MNKRQKKKREKLHDFGQSSWKDKRRLDKSYRDFLRLMQHSQKAKPKFEGGRRMIAIKTSLETIPETCDDCLWNGCKPHPFKGWSEVCELMGHCMDDDQEEEWIYDGNGRPSACPLLEVDE